MEIPQVDFALIGGSANWGIAFPEDLDAPGVRVVARDLSFATPYGDSPEWKLLEFDGAVTVDGRARRALYVFSHGWGVEAIDHRAHQKVFWLLREAGVRRIVSSSTSGSLNRAVLAGDLVIAADILELTQTQYSLLPGRVRYDCSGKALICPECSAVVERLGREIWPG
ncbi:phosphorylase family protein, partial [Pseudogemmobacter humi]|uniref:phosphorylase family protein n=1 Tax=Pseudogemmobacter humi TaxID=2483812 RepID=UPI0018EFFC82